MTHFVRLTTNFRGEYTIWARKGKPELRMQRR